LTGADKRKIISFMPGPEAFSDTSFLLKKLLADANINSNIDHAFTIIFEP